MSKQTWTPTEVARLLELRATGYPCGDVAIMLRRTEASVRHKLLAMGYSTQQLDRACRGHKEAVEELSAGPALAPIIEKATLAVDRDFERQREREDMETAKRFVLEERIIDVLDAHWSKSPPPNQMPRWLPEIPANATRDDQHAVALVGDLHMGKVVDPQEVPIVQAYNPALAVVRSAYLLKQWTEALKRRPVKSLYLIFLGDMVEGALGHIVQDHLTPPVAYQFDLALEHFK